MAHALVIRSASTSLAALLVGAVMLGLVTMQFRYAPLFPPGEPPRPVDAIVEALPPPPQPPATTIRRTVLLDHLTPLGEIVSEEPQTETFIPTSWEFVAAGPAEITDPRWTRRPDNLSRYYPRRALDRGIEGAVSLDCVVRVNGALDCAVASETPEGWGFGAAALRISREHEMVPAMRGGAPAEARYRMRVPFAID